MKLCIKDFQNYKVLLYFTECAYNSGELKFCSSIVLHVNNTFMKILTFLECFSGRFILLKMFHHLSMWLHQQLMKKHSS